MIYLEQLWSVGVGSKPHRLIVAVKRNLEWAAIGV